MTLIAKELKKKEFELIWQQYPNKDSKKQSELNFNKSVKTYHHINQINQALNNYLNLLKIESWRKCKSGSTFFNNWQDWIDYKRMTASEIIENYKPLTLEEREQIKYGFSDDCQNKIRLKLQKAWYQAKSRLKLNNAPASLW